MDRSYAANRAEAGPLHCVPVILKDNYDTADMPTTGGSLTLAKSVPLQDAFVVQRLRRAGALILAKANLMELARSGTTVSSLGGQTRNPYDLTRTPGGSSGGTGAAIAASFGIIGTGSDTGQSIRSQFGTCDGSFAIPLHTSDTLVMTRCVGARSCRTFASPSNVMSVIPARHSFARFVELFPRPPSRRHAGVGKPGILLDPREPVPQSNQVLANYWSANTWTALWPRVGFRPTWPIKRSVSRPSPESTAMYCLPLIP